MEKIIGLIDAPFTPFYENGEVNYEPIPAYAQMLAKNGMKGVFINGSSGEGYMLTEEERIKLTEAWVAAAPEGFKIIVHVGSTCVKSSIQGYPSPHIPVAFLPECKEEALCTGQSPSRYLPPPSIGDYLTMLQIYHHAQ